MTGQPALNRRSRAAGWLAAWPEVLLAAVLLLVIHETIAWSTLDGWYSDPDIHKHLLNAVRCWHLLPEGPLRWMEAFIHPLDPSTTFLCPLYPPLQAATGAIAFAIQGVASTTVADESLLTFVLALAVAVYGLGRLLVSREVGALAACFAITAGGIVQYSRSYYPDLSLAAMVALALWAGVGSKGLSNRRYTVMLGIAWGLAGMAKFTAVVFLLPPLILVLAEAGRAAWRARGQGRRAGWSGPTLNGLLAIVIGGAVILPWYVPRWSGILLAYQINSAAELTRAGPMPHESALALGGVHPDPWYYPREISLGMLHLPLTVALVVGIVWVLAQGALRRGFAHVFAALLMPLVVFSMMAIKDNRFILPVVPAACVLAAAWIPRTGWARPLVLTPILALGLLNVVGWRFEGQGTWMDPLLRFHTSAKLPAAPNRGGLPSVAIRVPTNARSELDALVGDMAQEVGPGDTCTVALDPPLLPLDLALYAQTPWLVIQHSSVQTEEWEEFDLATGLRRRVRAAQAGAPICWIGPARAASGRAPAAPPPAGMQFVGSFMVPSMGESTNPKAQRGQELVLYRRETPHDQDSSVTGGTAPPEGASDGTQP